MELASQPESAVAKGTGKRRGLPLTRTAEIESEVVAEVQPGACFKPLSTCVLPDGTRRMCVALPAGSLSDSVLGWLTSAQADGAPIVRRYARPIYEVVSSSLKVRKHVDISSKFVKQLEAGAQLHIVELQRADDGAIRAFVVVLNHALISAEKPIGWITATKATGTLTLAELRSEATSTAGFVAVPADSSAAPPLKTCTPPYAGYAPHSPSSSPPRNPISAHPFLGPSSPHPSSPPMHQHDTSAGFFVSSILGEHHPRAPSPTTSASPTSTATTSPPPANPGQASSMALFSKSSNSRSPAPKGKTKLHSAGGGRKAIKPGRGSSSTPPASQRSAYAYAYAYAYVCMCKHMHMHTHTHTHLFHASLLPQVDACQRSCRRPSRHRVFQAERKECTARVARRQRRQRWEAAGA